MTAVGSAWHGDVSYDNAALVDGWMHAYRLDGAAIVVDGRGNLAKGLTAHVQRHHQLLFFTKMDDYRDEQEHRFVVFDGSDEDYVFVNIQDALVAVVLGEAFPKSGRDEAAAMCLQHGAAIPG